MKNNRLSNPLGTPLTAKKLFLFDIDGTLAVGDTLFEGSRQLLDHIKAIGGKSYFITNNSTKSGDDYVKRFREVFGLESTKDLFITSGYMTIEFLKEHFMSQKIFVLGTSSFVAELKKNGLTVTESPDSDVACVVVAYDSELNYQKLINVCQVLSTMDVPYYATNPDLCCPIDFGFIPDCGSICNMIESSTGKKPIYLGKPAREVVDLCVAASGFSPEETIVVGDRMYTDILCGVNAGVDTCVLYTGEATKEEVAECSYKPSYEFETVAELLKAVQA
ncbi:MAG: HAD-IIA family hydrolase [Lachnospiraceae bacterium]|nr:HAD-IIA family hydrolase [Lachnospiraceae bacterium]